MQPCNRCNPILYSEIFFFLLKKRYDNNKKEKEALIKNHDLENKT